MIPKIIHYCWLSDDPIPTDLKKYMSTWKKILYDYKFILWDRKMFDFDKSLWVKEAYENKKYAFAADYIRLYALYNYGGIYLDTDVEVLKSFNPLLKLKMFVGFDHMEYRIEAATWGAEKRMPIIKTLLDYYKDKHFIKVDGSFMDTPMPDLINSILQNNNLFIKAVNNIDEAYQESDERTISVFPRTWFCPQNWYDYKLNKTNETFSIHHYKGAWLPDNIKRERDILRRLGPYMPRIWRKIQHIFELFIILF